MKKIILFASALAGLFLASCQRENLEPVADNGQVTFTVEAPAALQTRAIADGLNVDELVYEVWLTNTLGDLTQGAQKLYQAKADMAVDQNDGKNKATLTLDLVNDQKFTVLFWAQVGGTGVYNTTELNAVTYTHKEAEYYTANDENLAAFYAVAYVNDCQHVKQNGDPTVSEVTLRRPFAQLNLGTLNTSTEYTVDLVSSKVKVTNANTVFNVATSKASAPQVMEFRMNGVPTDPATLTVNTTTNTTTYEYAGMNYLFAGDNATVEYDIQTVVYNNNATAETGMTAHVTNTVSSVPLKENYRTNIIGNLLTSKVDYVIVVDADFNTVDEDLRLVSNSEELAAAVAEAKSGETIYIEGEVTMPYFTDKALNFIGLSERAVVKQSPATHIDEFYSGAELHFKNLTLVGESYKNNTQGYQKAAKETYTDCHFQNYIMFAGVETIVNDCTFENEGQYFWTGTANDITFNNCQFNGKERAVKVCTVGNNGEREVTFNDCEFTAQNPVKAAIEIDGSKGSSYVVNINGCTHSGFAAGANTGNTLFNIEGAENVTVYVNGAKWLGNDNWDKSNITVYTAEELKNEVNAATGNITVTFGADLTGKIRLNQKRDVKVTIDGNDKKFTGGIHIYGNGAAGNLGMTIKNINFDGTGLTSDEGCIYTTGGINTSNSYANNVTIENCTFTGAGVAAIRQNVGGDNNWKIKDCTVLSDMHSFLQISNTGENLEIENCKVYSKNGANLNYTAKASFTGCEFDVQGYAVRVGVNGSNSTVTKVFNFTNCTLKSANDDGDAVVIIRQDAQQATLNFVDTELIGDPQISGSVEGKTTINGLN